MRERGRVKLDCEKVGLDSKAGGGCAGDHSRTVEFTTSAVDRASARWLLVGRETGKLWAKVGGGRGGGEGRPKVGTAGRRNHFQHGWESQEKKRERPGGRVSHEGPAVECALCSIGCRAL